MQPGSAAEVLQLLQTIEQRSLVDHAELPQQKETARSWEGVLCSVAGYPLVAPLKQIVEILNQIPPLTRVPGTRDWLAGIANVRGTLLPVVDLQRYLGGKPLASGRRTRILVIDQHGVNCGLLVGNVQGMRHFADNQDAELPALAVSIQPYVEKGCQVDGELRPVLDLQRLAATSEFQVAAL